jgi:Mn-dependent DtxR family transcriptional regulator
VSSLRQSIIDLLEQHDHPLSTKEIAEKLSLEYNTLSKKLSLMKKDGHISSPSRGLYQSNRPVPALETTLEYI